MSALTVVETDLACEREKRRVTTRQSPTTDTHRFGCGFDSTALDAGRIVSATDRDDRPATTTRRREPDDANPTTRTKTFDSRRASPRIASRPIARASSVPSSSNHIIIARAGRDTPRRIHPLEPRARRDSPRARARDASNASTRIETRTWTLVALKAATRPTKEEARSTDIGSVLE